MSSGYFSVPCRLGNHSCTDEEGLEFFNGLWFLAEFVKASIDCQIALLLARVGREATYVWREQTDVRIGRLELSEHPVHLPNSLWSIHSWHTVVAQDKLEGRQDGVDGLSLETAPKKLECILSIQYGGA